MSVRSATSLSQESSSYETVERVELEQCRARVTTRAEGAESSCKARIELFSQESLRAISI